MDMQKKISGGRTQRNGNHITSSAPRADANALVEVEKSLPCPSSTLHLVDTHPLFRSCSYQNVFQTLRRGQGDHWLINFHLLLHKDHLLLQYHWEVSLRILKAMLHFLEGTFLVTEDPETIRMRPSCGPTKPTFSVPTITMLR